MVNILKFLTFYSVIFGLNFTFHEMVHSAEPDQTAPEGAVWSWSTLFAYAILSETLEKRLEGIYHTHYLAATTSPLTYPYKHKCWHSWYPIFFWEFWEIFCFQLWKKKNITEPAHDKGNLSYSQPAKVQTSLHISPASSEPLLLCSWDLEEASGKNISVAQIRGLLMCIWITTNRKTIRFLFFMCQFKIVCLCWGFTAQSTQWGHVKRGQFT